MSPSGKWRGWLAVTGGVLVHLTIGTIYSYGNMAPYMTSYIRKYSYPSTLSYQESSFIFALMLFGQGSSMFIGGYIEAKLGPRITTLIGCLLVSMGMMLSALSIRVSFFLLLLTYGLIFGLGVGIAYVPPLVCAMKWLPEKKGLVNGLVVAGFGGGAFIFNQIQTGYLNPHNLDPNVTDSQDHTAKYYDQDSILDKVPMSYVLQGGIYLAIQIVGVILLKDPPDNGVNNSLYNDESGLLDAQSQAKKTTHMDASDPEGPTEEGDEDGQSKRLPFGIPFPLENGGDSKASGLDLPPKVMVRTTAFWLLWATFLVNGQGIMFISSLYKAYGQMFIPDDHFLALVGSFAAIFNAGGRLFWGCLADRYSYKLAMVLLTGSNAIFILTLVAAQYGGKAMFFIWICGIFFTFSGNFALFPTATARAFGSKYVGPNYGIVFTSVALSSAIGAVLATTLHDHLAWFGMFMIMAGFSIIGLVLTFFFRVKNQEGNHI
ncbi:oxalate:formate antiporter-like [Lytechinus variegatus]|uniref:oxalate:formate antiporter-like n=1 Tax=Lytechinus variegatus TaxID=7654 RepID=UPI001BB27D8D|nr:oxalate:formate antiporter-like [Lytechinus variegatus]